MCMRKVFFRAGETTAWQIRLLSKPFPSQVQIPQKKKKGKEKKKKTTKIKHSAVLCTQPEYKPSASGRQTALLIAETKNSSELPE